MNLPPALLFQPTDIHDDSNNLASMSKVLNVLSFLKGDGEGDMIQALPDEEDDEDGTTTKEPDATPPAGTEIDLEPEPEPEPEPDLTDEIEVNPPAETKRIEPVTQPVQVSQPAPVSAPPTHATPTPAATAAHGPVVPAHAPTNAHSSDGDYAEVQTEILKAITTVINAELSVESKRKLLKTLQHQISSFEDKLMHASEDQLVVLAKEFGVEDVPKKDRQATIETLLKYGRVQ